MQNVTLTVPMTPLTGVWSNAALGHRRQRQLLQLWEHSVYNQPYQYASPMCRWNWNSSSHERQRSLSTTFLLWSGQQHHERWMRQHSDYSIHDLHCSFCHHSFYTYTGDPEQQWEIQGDHIVSMGDDCTMVLDVFGALFCIRRTGSKIKIGISRISLYCSTQICNLLIITFMGVMLDFPPF
jgi:hypothetical protein